MIIPNILLCYWKIYIFIDIDKILATFYTIHIVSKCHIHQQYRTYILTVTVIHILAVTAIHIGSNCHTYGQLL